MSKEELLNIYGGAISGTLINALVRAINAVLEVGRSLGSAVRRISSGSSCSF